MNHNPGVKHDICVYGATSAGVAAAIAAARCGKSVVLLESSNHLGGLTTGGLGATDIGYKAAIGGMAREFYERIYRYYERPEAWVWTAPEQSTGAAPESQNDPLQRDAVAETRGRPAKWTFEPHVAMQIFREMLAEAGVEPLFGQRLASVEMEDGRLTALRMENSAVFRAHVFIDASYEGDLMAQAGVSYHVGREANAIYGETINGVRAQTPHHQFHVPVDPYREPGNPTSGLLPFIQAEEMGEPGAGDPKVQAYNFRLCMTQIPKNRVPWTAPPGYDAADYELLARYLEASEIAGKQFRALGWGGLMNPVAMPNGKTDTNNSGAFSTDFIGCNYAYPEADFATRQRIWQEHENYLRGFLYFLATNERVPQYLRDEMASWGLARDEFVETAHWPPQLYVREARRMVADCVVTEADCRAQRVADDAVGVAAYQMDSHNCQRIVRDGIVQNEGDVQIPTEPFPISYRAIVPRRGECPNLLVPVCLSASHTAYGSIRMEPVFMILGQSAAIAGALALDSGCAVQDLPYETLRPQLENAEQILVAPSKVAQT